MLNRDSGRITLWNNKTYDLSRFLLFYTSNIGAEIFQGNNHLSMARKSEAACQRLVMMFNSPEFIARFGKFNYGIFAFNSLKPEHLRQITRKFMNDKLNYFRTIRETKIEAGSLLIPENLNVLGYSPGVVDHALLQTNTTKNGARELRDIVERLLNQVYTQAITTQTMTGFLHLEQSQITLKPESPTNPIRIQ